MRMLMNNLDPDVAERPEDLVVYGGTGRAARSWDAYDAIVTPAAPGIAPKGLGSTGDPAFCTLWTLSGLPALSLPLFAGEGGLPLGAQLVGPRGRDGRLLRTATALIETLAEAHKSPRRPRTRR